MDLAIFLTEKLHGVFPSLCTEPLGFGNSWEMLVLLQTLVIATIWISFQLLLELFASVLIASTVINFFSRIEGALQTKEMFMWKTEAF